MAILKNENSGVSTAVHRLLLYGLVGPLFFIVVFLMEGATRADYDPLRQPVSSLSIGDLGWMQSANFIISGVLILAFALGLWFVLRRTGDASTPSPSTWGPVLIGLVGLGLIGAGIFTCDPMAGYPPGTPLIPVIRSTRYASRTTPPVRRIASTRPSRTVA